MEPNAAVQNRPINFFMAGGQYISDNFNMQIIDTSLPNAFENLDLTTIKPDMMTNYIESEKLPQEAPKAANKDGILHSIAEFFAPAKESNN